jgi:hypothetical protein
VLQPTPTAARPLFLQAWRAALAATVDPSYTRLLTNVANEVVEFELGLVQRGGDPTDLKAFLAGLPEPGVPSLLQLDSVLVARATLAVGAGDWAGAVEVLTAPGPAGCFPTLASERAQLMDLWVQAMVLKAGGPQGLTPYQLRSLRVDNPVPRNIGCPYGGGEGYPNCAYW